MALEVTLGGDRLGSGNKQKIEMHNYQMSSFNLEQDFKSSMAPGVLYPFIKMVGTPHGTFDIDLDTFVRTLPTKGPLFGSFKLQLDLFSVPFRLYQGILHNNPTRIGMKMDSVYLPKLFIQHTEGDGAPMVYGSNRYNRQVNESALMKYLGLSGIGSYDDSDPIRIGRKVNAVPALAYYDIFKCYYSNKQEQNAYVITPGNVTMKDNIVEKVWKWNFNPAVPGTGYWEEVPTKEIIFYLNSNESLYGTKIKFQTTIPIQDNNSDLIKTTGYDSEDSNYWTKNDITTIPGITLEENENEYILYLTGTGVTNLIEQTEGDTSCKVNFELEEETTLYTSNIQLTPFALQNIDDMRQALLSKNAIGDEFVIKKTSGDWDTASGTDGTGLPYSTLVNETVDGLNLNAFQMNGLVIKTYQSDLFNNWLDTEWIDGEEGIAALTAISTSEGQFTVDSFVFAEKLYDIYNRIATGGGTYEDWQEAVYGEGAIRKCETPMYIGGMAAEIMFEEVISSAETKVDGDYQALGSLGGKGTQVNRRGGNNIHVKMEEPGYVMGIVSITPRISYSQGNDWDLTELDTLDDLHKPGMDGIGFQDLIIEQMAWWNTQVTERADVIKHSAGKQTAWINYQTAVDKCFGDFAKQDKYAFMVLNRNYEMDESVNAQGVKDITTYIDPQKFNYAFAYTDLAAQNFWVQIHSKVIARRKMGAQQIPNL